MLEEMMTEEVKNLFLEDLFKDNFTYPNHRFSLRYRYRKKRVLNQLSQKKQQMDSETTLFNTTHMRIPMKYVLLIVILLVLTILGFTIYRNYSGLFVKEQDTFSMMFADYNQDAPEVLTEKFYIDMNLSDYEQEVVEDSVVCRWVTYKLNGEKQFDVMQMTIAESSSRLNTENAIIMPTNITINDWKGMYYQAYDGWYVYFFNRKDYVVSYSGVLNKNDVEKLAKATKFE